jgi:sporulation protein YlmC with PRC-barrel domain
MSAGGDSERFTIGTEVEASDGRCGRLTGVIVDPVAQKLTHLIIKPRHHHGFGRLVPVGLVASGSDALRLKCTEAEFLALDEAEEVQFTPATGDTWSYPGGAAYAWPYYELGGVAGFGAAGVGEIGNPPGPGPEVTDRIPSGEVEVRRGDQVHASDGWIGSVKGLVVDPADNHVTHLLLDEGHLWGRKQVAIPIGKTARIDDEIRVQMTKEAIKNLAPVSLGD